MAALLRDCLHPRGLGGVLPWLNEDKAMKVYQVHSYREYQRKIAKRTFFIVYKRLRPPQFLLSWEETCTCCCVRNCFHGSSRSLRAAERQHWAVGRAVAAWQSRFVQHRALRDVPSAGRQLWGIFLLLSAKEQVAFKDTNVPLETILIRAWLWIPWLLLLRPVATGLGPWSGGNVSARHLHVF